MPEARTCPYCAEEILAAAIKCKHCGEFLNRPDPATATPLPQKPQSPPISWHSDGTTWRCGAHSIDRCRMCASQSPPPTTRGKRGEVDAGQGGPLSATATSFDPPPKSSPYVNRKISEVGTQSDAGLACPYCGGTSFKEKRSKKAKILAVPTLGVGTFLVPKTRVKCVTCGKEYLRG